MTCLHQLIEFANMQLSYRHDERPAKAICVGRKKFNLHVSTTRWDFHVQGKSCGFGVGVLVVAPALFFVCFCCFFLLAKRKSGRDLRVVAAVVWFPVGL